MLHILMIGYGTSSIGSALSTLYLALNLKPASHRLSS